MVNTLSTELVEGKNARLVVDAAELRVTTGPDKGLRFPLSADSILIGSAPTADLVLHDKTVSTRHAEIQLTERGYVIRDLESTNGIALGKQLIHRAPLSHGLKLALGETTILVHALGKQLSVPLADSGESLGLVAHSVKMRAFVAALEQAALSDGTVLIEGETGTGKELAAQALHRLSSRNAGPFVTFDASAVPASLAAVELFGAEKGAFTGAATARPGLLESADGGTFFIDEIGELPLDLQPLLLGVLERKRSRRVGGKTDHAHDVRIVAATHRNLAEEVRAKRFREDLFYRLAVVRLRVPPLRERREDTPLLVDQFAREAGITISPDSLSPFSSYDWPGNVRELRNTITRMVVQSTGAHEAILDPAKRSASRLFDEDGQLRPWLDAARIGRAELEREYVQEAFLQAGGKLSKAAQLAGITHQSLAALADKHGLRRRGG
jgi:DNA-binding NtrC family response regulator